MVQSSIKQQTYIGFRDGRESYFFHEGGRGGEGQGQKSMGRGGESPPPHSAGRGGAGAGNILHVSAD